MSFSVLVAAAIASQTYRPSGDFIMPLLNGLADDLGEALCARVDGEVDIRVRTAWNENALT